VEVTAHACMRGALVRAYLSVSHLPIVIWFGCFELLWS